MPSAFSQPSQDSPSKFTRIDGIGLWNSWTRNFTTPLLALLDLLDNAFDAALVDPQDLTSTGAASMNGDSGDGSNFRGKIHITPDQHLDQGGITTGMTITNNCARMTKPLKNILEVYSSSKGKATESIGENGVGLKQGCATLSDLSFVFMRNGQELSLGVLARSLQKPEGCILPSFVFGSYETDELQREMECMFRNQEIEVGECVKHYGGGDLHAGINRLLLNFAVLKDKNEDMGGWGNDEHVFSIVLHEVRHGNAMHRTSQNVTEEAPHFDDHGESTIGGLWQKEYATRAKSLMNSLYAELPRHYIHIPLTFDVRVNAMPVQFFYWQKRLVELTVFYPRISNQTLWYENSSWLENGYPIRIFAGFDPVRLGNEREGKALNLYVYSRRSGRLIKKEEDARATLGLSNGGTNFCQGLTLIVDDCQGELPLSPTKQDIAFGEEGHGDKHKENLFSWIGGIANCYYNYHIAKFEKKKAPLTEAVKRLLPQVRARGMVDARLIATLNLTYFADVRWVGYQKRIRNRGGFSVIDGTDTLWHLEGAKVAKKKKTTPSRNSLDATRTVEPVQVESSQVIDTDDGIVASIVEDTNEKSSKKRKNDQMSSMDDWDEIPRKRSSRNSVSYNEFDESDDDEERRRKKKKKKKKKKKDKQRRLEEASENKASINADSDDESKRSSEAGDEMENELLDDVGAAVSAAVATVSKSSSSPTKEMKPDHVGSADNSNLGETPEYKLEIEKLNTKVKALVNKVSEKNLEVTKLKEELQQLKAQQEVDKKTLKKEMYKMAKVNKDLKQIMSLEKQEKESLQRENVHLKERERTNEQLLRGEEERVKLLQSKLQYYQNMQENTSTEDQGGSDNANSGESNSNNCDNEDKNTGQNTSAGTSLRALFAGNSSNGPTSGNGGADGDNSSLGSFPYEDF